MEKAVQAIQANNANNADLSWMWKKQNSKPTKLFTTASMKPINTVNTGKRTLSRTPSPTMPTSGGYRKSRKSRRTHRARKSHTRRHR